MTIIIVGIIVLALISVGLMIYGRDDYGFMASFCSFIGFIGCIVSAIGAVGLMLLGWDWAASEYKMEIINREYNTNYTREEIFYASGVIETIRELDRKRIELNGDLLTGEK